MLGLNTEDVGMLLATSIIGAVLVWGTIKVLFASIQKRKMDRRRDYF
ncbi:hypothetical protein [Pedobacter rhizosphaerae]|uniref:Uncharacterized protein n=1 Tax=Pedobacter rhizosphaerae TaxID=390241 RepID=A0A1H9VLG7_9SPHI|nr:hypothetical protein [Pedobacter rhizosphaerae]SES22368.1 hypothetical protein SAMN04488023_14443 [Pedobacter rhizosphaerae]